MKQLCRHGWFYLVQIIFVQHMLPNSSVAFSLCCAYDFMQALSHFLPRELAWGSQAFLSEAENESGYHDHHNDWKMPSLECIVICSFLKINHSQLLTLLLAKKKKNNNKERKCYIWSKYELYWSPRKHWLLCLPHYRKCLYVYIGADLKINLCTSKKGCMWSVLLNLQSLDSVIQVLLILDMAGKS